MSFCVLVRVFIILLEDHVCVLKNCQEGSEDNLDYAIIHVVGRGRYRSGSRTGKHSKRKIRHVPLPVLPANIFFYFLGSSPPDHKIMLLNNRQAHCKISRIYLDQHTALVYVAEAYVDEEGDINLPHLCLLCKTSGNFWQVESRVAMICCDSVPLTVSKFCVSPHGRRLREDFDSFEKPSIPLANKLSTLTNKGDL